MTFTHKPGDEWACRSSDDYYRIAWKGERFEAFHITALWAQPISIAETHTLALAEAACNEHNSRVMNP